MCTTLELLGLDELPALSALNPIVHYSHRYFALAAWEIIFGGRRLIGATVGGLGRGSEVPSYLCP